MPDSSRAPATPWAVQPTKWLAAIVESSDDAIIGKTLDSVIRTWNAGAERIFGYKAPEIIGQSMLRLLPPELQAEEAAIIARLSRNERVEHYETVRVRKDGMRIEVSLTTSPILDDHGNVVGASQISRDITEANRLRRAEREMNEQLQEQAVELEQQASELEQQIEEAQTLQVELEHANEELQRALASSSTARAEAERANRAKSQFLATMSHELRTPLNAIAGYVDILELGLHGSLGAEQRADLERIRHNQRILLRLIEDLLDMAKLESGRVAYRITDVRVDELLQALEASIAPALRKNGVSYHFAACGTSVTVRADRHKVEQIMLNLLSNAAKFTERGRVEVRCDVEHDTVRVQVSDTGRGIAPHMLETVFEPFVQEEQEFTRTAEGTGLGLTISRQLARGMGGDVTVRSVVGEGSTFTLALPRGG